MFSIQFADPNSTLSTAMSNWTTYTPILKGSSDDPSPVTYSVQIGRYLKIGKMCIAMVNLTTTSITKSTLTDNLRVSLPFTSANNVNSVYISSAAIENSTAVVNGSLLQISANTAYVEFKSAPVAAATAFLTYGLTSLGVLSNTITFKFTCMYETT